MEINQEQSIEKIVSNANQYKAELIENLENRIIELEEVLIEIQEESSEVIKHCIANAKQYDVNYVPDKGITEKLSFWIDNLNVVKQKLLTLNLNQADIFDQDTYLKKAQNLLDLIDDKLKEEDNKFIKANKERFEEACTKKRESEIELENLKIELGILETKKTELEEENLQAQTKIDKTKVRFLNKRRNQRRSNLILSNSETIEGIKDQIRILNERINKLEIISKSNHFVPKPEGENPVNPNPAEIMEENKGIEPGDE